MRKKITGIFFFLFSCYLSSNANDSLIHHLLQRLDYLQVNHAAYFPQGIFPSYRQYSTKDHPFKDDDNIFFTGITGLTLQQLRPYFQQEDQIICDSIIQRIKTIAPKFKNAKGRNTYNFWRTDTPKIFPNGGWLNVFNHSFALPDDLDDTAVMLLVLKESDSVFAEVHQLMQSFTNKAENPARTTLSAYKGIEAYSVWFGKKMLVELDACVLCNSLLMVQSKNLEWSKTDSASVGFLVQMIEHKDHITHPDVMSVYYKTTPAILYHLSRLMQIKKINALEKYKAQLIIDANQAYAASNNLLEKILLRTALLRWGVSLPHEEIFSHDLVKEVEETHLVFFIANLACILPKNLAFGLFNLGLTRFYFYCPAYYDALLLEYLVLQKRFNEHKSVSD
jgi:hypothetical protein